MNFLMDSGGIADLASLSTSPLAIGVGLDSVCENGAPA